MRVIRDFTGRVCTGYSLFVRAKSTIYRDLLNAVLADAQMRGEYLDGFLVRVSENGHSVLIGDTESDEQRGGRTLPSAAGGDEAEVFPPRIGPS